MTNGTFALEYQPYRDIELLAHPSFACVLIFQDGYAGERTRAKINRLYWIKCDE